MYFIVQYLLYLILLFGKTPCFLRKVDGKGGRDTISQKSKSLYYCSSKHLGKKIHSKLLKFQILKSLVIDMEVYYIGQ